MSHPSSMESGRVSSRGQQPAMRLDRRSVLRGTLRSVAAVSVGAFTSMVGGCRPSQTDATSRVPSASKASVPLRVLWGGSEEDADTLRRSWGSVSEQMLVIEIRDPRIGSVMDEWIDAAKKTDVVVFPVSMTGTLAESIGLLPLAEKTLAELKAHGRSIPVFHRSLMQWGETTCMIPIGGHQLALLVGEDAPDRLQPVEASGSESTDAGSGRSVTWSAYHDAVKDVDGRASEPLAAGWAAESYFARLVTSIRSSWLFDRATLEPLLATPPYIEALAQMAETATLYRSRQQTPGEVWRDVTRGRFLFGIGCPPVVFTEEDTLDPSSTATRLRRLPIGVPEVTSTEPVRRSVSLSHSLAVAISSACRQTAAANQFLRWFTGGEGSEGLYRQVNAMVSRSAPAFESSGSLTSPGYGEFLRSQWSLPNVASALRIIDAPRYQSALDDAVRACVLQGRDAETVLAETADTWQSLTDAIGRPKQIRAWQGG
ncbi:MAG: hypothetical protein AAGD07_17605 [Planctomycetota bacterium]